VAGGSTGAEILAGSFRFLSTFGLRIGDLVLDLTSRAALGEDSLPALESGFFFVSLGF
jgi:hypothetical protein